ncbi:MAG TPA: TetR/AcrR family transcriptional regulator [Dehalococcoidia bacterium]|nr:TetR/AcrR family transcriptional regulator [Dehalococcoidia bacterium]
MARTSDARERLIRSAGRLFHSRGHTAVGVNDICLDAGVQKGSFYHFFASKRDLILAVVESEWSEFETRLLRPTFGSGLPPLSRIARVFEFAYERQCRIKEREGKALGCPFGNVAQELSAHDPLIRARLDRLFLDWASYFEGAISDAIKTQELSRHIDPATTAQGMLAYLEGLLLLAKTFDDPEIVNQLTPNSQQLASLCWTSRNV